MHRTGMLLNWIHPTLDWLCIESLYTVQALTEGAVAWVLMDQMPPLVGSNWSCHDSTTLSDALFGWIALFLFHCWLPRPEESSLQPIVQSCGHWVVHLRTRLWAPEENLFADGLACTCQTFCLWTSIRLFLRLDPISWILSIDDRLPLVAVMPLVSRFCWTLASFKLFPDILGECGDGWQTDS